MSADTQKVEYLRLLIDEFNRIWPGGRVRSSEPRERQSFIDHQRKIDKLRSLIEQEVGL